MSIPSDVAVDNKPLTLGDSRPDVSQRYVKDQQDIDPLFREYPTFIAAITSVKRAYSSELDLIFGLPDRNKTLSSFRPPDEFFTNRTDVLSSAAIPSLGSMEKRAHNIEKLKALPKNTKLSKELEGDRQILLKFYEEVEQIEENLEKIKCSILEFTQG